MASALHAGERLQPVTVCAVLSDLQLYNGRRIEIRGYWDSMRLQDSCKLALKTKGAYPVGNTILSCDENCKQILSDAEYIWPNTIYLKTSTITYPEGSKIGIGIQTISPDEYDKAFQKLLGLKPGTAIATIVGELETRNDLEIGLDIFSQNGVEPFGFGQNGTYSYPAQLIIREIKDIEGQPREGEIPPIGGTLEQ